MLMDYASAIKAYGNDYGIKKAIEEKKLFRIDDGVYSTKLIVSEEAALCFRYPKAVLALSSAFYLHGLTDTTPDYYEMATSRDAAKIHDSRAGRSFRRGRYSTLGRRGSKRTEQSLFTIWRDAPSTCSVISPNSLMTITKRFYVILDPALAKWTFGNFRTTSPRCRGRNV